MKSRTVIQGGRVLATLIKEIQSYIKKQLKPDRYRHSMGVMETAVKLAQRYNVDVEKAALAGILHDCGKNCSESNPILILESSGYQVNEIERFDPELLHGHIGAMIATEKFNIHDDEILSAIACHTTGKKNMSKLDQIIYIADYIEPNRKSDWVYPLRASAYANLEDCIVMCADCTMTFIMKKGKPIHPSTMDMRNEMIMKRKACL